MFCTNIKIFKQIKTLMFPDEMRLVREQLRAAKGFRRRLVPAPMCCSQDETNEESSMSDRADDSLSSISMGDGIQSIGVSVDEDHTLSPINLNNARVCVGSIVKFTSLFSAESDNEATVQVVPPDSGDFCSMDENLQAHIAENVCDRAQLGVFSDDTMSPLTKAFYDADKHYFGEMGGNASFAGTYGETTFISNVKKCRFLKKYCDFGKHSRFCDFGSGKGKPSFTFTDECGLSFGCEVENNRYLVSFFFTFCSCAPHLSTYRSL